MRNRYDAFLYRVLESVMASGNAVQIPSVLLKLADHFARRKHTFSLCLSINVVYSTQLIGKMQIPIKLLAAVLVLGMAFAGGYRYAAALYEKDAAELREAEAVARADMGRKQYAKMVDAMDALAGLRAELSRARADAERVRRAAEVRERRQSAPACSAERAAVSACEGLLRESVGLLAEGRGLLQETAGVHDAVTANFGHN